MNKKIGTRLKLLLFEKGFSSPKKFEEYLQKNDRENYVCEDTIMNVIKGKNMNHSTLETIAGGLGISVEFLTADYIPLVDEYLEYEVKPRMDKKDFSMTNHPEVVSGLYSISKRLYPNDIEETFGR